MATSSILENIRVNNPKAVEEFVAAMESSANDTLRPRTEEQRSSVVTDSARLRCFVEKALQKRDVQH